MTLVKPNSAPDISKLEIQQAVDAVDAVEAFLALVK
jgi:hypothetical protein